MGTILAIPSPDTGFFARPSLHFARPVMVNRAPRTGETYGPPEQQIAGTGRPRGTFQTAMDKAMSLKLASVVLIVGLVGCGAGNQDNQSSGEGPMENATLTTFALTSEAFTDGQPIPTEFTCDGADRPPPLAWGEPPEGTRGFALIVDDPDAPSGTFRHWGAYDIPASARSLGGDFPQAVNDFGKTGYGGPCPPQGHGPHRYRFKLMALDVDQLEINPGASIKDVEAAAEKHLVGRAELVARYERK
jgi:Raf kinase inhibitor-like YbhB/YbcL family protein